MTTEIGYSTANTRLEFEWFRARAAAHHARIPEEILSAGDNPDKISEYSFGPSPSLAAISSAASMLRKRPRQPLVDRRIPEPDFGGAALTALTQLLNSSLERNPSVGMPGFDTGQRQRLVSACSSAEAWFSRLAIAMTTKVPLPNVQIITHEGEPVILRKGRLAAYSHTSGLTLVPMNQSGVTIPAGSIVRAETTEDLPRRGKSFEGNEILWGVTSVESDMLTGFAMNRLSLFALPISERTSDFITKFRVPHSVTPISESNIWEHMEQATVEDFRMLAAQALQAA